MSEANKAMNLFRQAAVMLLLLTGGLAWSQSTLDVQTTVQKEVVTVNEAGEEEKDLVPAETVIPGERVIYTITFRNTGDDSADDVIITNPISENLTYVPGSAFGPGMTLQFSVDGVNFAAADELMIDDDGEMRAAQPDEYTHIRWVMQSDLVSGAQGTVRFSAQLN